MAELSFGAKGKRWSALARLIAKSDSSITVQETSETIILKGPCITVTRQMVESACFPKGMKNVEAAEVILFGLALRRKGELITQDKDRIVIGDDDGERPMTIRFRADHQQDIARLSAELEISRNQFVVSAVERFINFLETSRQLPELDDEEY